MQVATRCGPRYVYVVKAAGLDASDLASVPSDDSIYSDALTKCFAAVIVEVPG